MDDAMDMVAPDGGLWIRRQVFEHSVGSATLLASSSAALIDFPRLARALFAASVTMHPDEAPAVTYESYAAIARDHAHLSAPQDADLIIEALETNAPAAFVRCNDVDKLAPGRQVDYRQLLIPVPELVAFMKLHAAAAVAARFRESADAVWPAGASVGEAAADAAISMDQAPPSPDQHSRSAGRAPHTSPLLSAAHHSSPAALPQRHSPSTSPRHPTVQQPSTFSPRTASSPPQQQPAVGSAKDGCGEPRPTTPTAAAAGTATAAAAVPSVSPTRTSAISAGRAPAVSPPRMNSTPPSSVPSLSLLRSPREGGSSGDSSAVRKKTTPHSPSAAMLNSSSAIVASVANSLQRETHLVASNVQALLTCIAASYGQSVPVESGSGAGGASGSLAASTRSNGRAGVLTSRVTPPSPSARNGPGGSGRKAAAVDDRNGDDQDDDDVDDDDDHDGDDDGDDDGDGDGDDDDDDGAVDNRQQIAKVAPGGAMAAAEEASDGTLSDIDDARGADARAGPGGRAPLDSSCASDTSAAKATAASMLMITRAMMDNLSFLLTTAAAADGDRHVSISSIVPEWRDPSCNEAVPLGRVVELTTSALARVSADPGSGPIDTAEIRDLERKTVIRSKLPATSVDQAEFPHGREVRITDCSESNVYLLCSLGRVSVMACSDFTLFVGSCVSVSVINCNRVRVHAIARVCRVTNCFDSELYMCTNRRPQIVGDCRGILFAPYNAVYPHLQRDLAAVGVDPSRNTWDEFYRPTPSRERSSPTPDGGMELAAAIVTKLPPARFLPFAVPVNVDGAGAEATGLLDGGPEELQALFNLQLPLPAEYQQAVDERREAVDHMLRQIDKLPSDVQAPEGAARAEDAMTDLHSAAERAEGESGAVTPPSGVSPPSSPADQQQPAPVSLRTHARQLVQERFYAWLVSSGNMRQVHDLVYLPADADDSLVGGAAAAATPADSPDGHQ